jgi:hypothetical protein
MDLTPSQNAKRETDELNNRLTETRNPGHPLVETGPVNKQQNNLTASS